MDFHDEHLTSIPDDACTCTCTCHQHNTETDVEYLTRQASSLGCSLPDSPFQIGKLNISFHHGMVFTHDGFMRQGLTQDELDGLLTHFAGQPYTPPPGVISPLNQLAEAVLAAGGEIRTLNYPAPEHHEDTGIAVTVDGRTYFGRQITCHMDGSHHSLYADFLIAQYQRSADSAEQETPGNITWYEHPLSRLAAPDAITETHGRLSVELTGELEELTNQLYSGGGEGTLTVSRELLRYLVPAPF